MKIYINLFVVCVILLYIKQANAQIEQTIKYQSHVTDALELPNDVAIAGVQGVGNVLSDVFKNRVVDIFAVVVAAGSTASSIDAELLAFQVDDTTVFDIRVEGGKIEVRRRIGDNWASYIIYDEVFHGSNIFTFIISPDYIAIMVDHDNDNWNVAPVLFGINSNEGTDQYSAGMGSHVTPFFDADSENEGRIRSAYEFTVYPMTDDYDTYAEIQLWLDDQAQKDLSVNAKTGSDITDIGIVLSMSEVNGLEELADIDFYAYPNPSSEFIIIEGLEANEVVFIYNILGNKVFETSNKQINISTFSEGIYLVKSASGKNVLKFVKQ